MAVSWPGPPPHVSPDRPAYPALGYHQLQRGGLPGWWRPVLGVVLAAVLGLLVVPGVLQVFVVIWVVTRGKDLEDEFQRLLSLEDPTPFGLAFLNVTLAALIPIVFFVSWALHRLKPGWVTSVAPRMRWGFFSACLGLSFVALVATVIVSVVLPSQPGTGDIAGQVNEIDAQAQRFLLVVLFLTPLQAAGEEYFFRGYLTQAFGKSLPTAVAVLGPALLFALAHGAQDAPIFFDRFAFGVVAGVLVVRTGGLEAGIAMHVLNNWLAFSLALLFGEMDSVLDPSGGSWWSIPVTLTQSLVYLGLVLWVARRRNLARTADPAVLAASTGRV